MIEVDRSKFGDVHVRIDVEVEHACTAEAHNTAHAGSQHLHRQSC
jgi:hypothetical protein